MADKYPFKVDWEAKQYVGIHLKWDYEKQELCTSMDGYVKTQPLSMYNAQKRGGVGKSATKTKEEDSILLDKSFP